MAQCQVGDLRIAYERIGTGPCVLLLHGYVGDAATTFGAQLEGLGSEFDVVAPDLPGAGHSSDPPESFRLADFADAIGGLAAELGLGPVHLLGLSFGAALALELYRRHREGVRSLVLVSGYAGWRGSLAPRETKHRLDQVLRLADLDPREFASAVAGSMFVKAADPATVRRFATAIEQFHPPGLKAMARAVAEADLRDVLPMVEVPTLVVAGEFDVRAPITVARRLHEAIHGSELVIIPGAGHLCTIDAPDQVTDAVRGFLRNV